MQNGNSEKREGAFLFLSHSHNDILKVRDIRNRLEDAGFEPLCFYLKCLTDDSEIEDLIQREIDAREWFLFIDSENARRSRWVTMEREYIRQSDQRKIITVDLNDDESVQRAIDRIVGNLRIFVSYAYKDRELAARIARRLRQRDYYVWFDLDGLLNSNNWAAQIDQEIRRAAEEGAFLTLLTPQSVTSQMCRKELARALERGATVLPVLVGDVQLPPEWAFLLGNLHHLHLPAEPDDASIDRMVDVIGRRIVGEEG